MRVVVAKKPFKGRAVGTEIDIDKRDARVLLALGRVALVEDVVVVAEPEPEQPKPQKRVYRRRDLTSED
jgi:hypothetical protein